MDGSLKTALTESLENGQINGNFNLGKFDQVCYKKKYIFNLFDNKTHKVSHLST